MSDPDFICPLPLVLTDGPSDTTIWAYEPGNCAVPCPSIAYEDDEWDGNVILYRTVSFVSLILSLLVFINHMCQFSPRKYIRIMFIGGFLFASFILTIFLHKNKHSEVICNTNAHYVESAPLCVFQAAAYIFSVCWIISWSCIFAWDVYSQVRNNFSISYMANRMSYNMRFTLLAFLFSSIVTILPLSAGNLGFDPKANMPICLYLVSDDSSYFWLTFFLPLVVMVVVCNVIGFATVVEIQRIYVISSGHNKDPPLHKLYDEEDVGRSPVGGVLDDDYARDSHQHESSRSHHSTSVLDAQSSQRDSIHSMAHTPQSSLSQMGSHQHSNSIPMSIPYTQTPKVSPHRDGSLTPKMLRMKTAPQLSSSYLLESDVADLDWSNQNQQWLVNAAGQGHAFNKSRSVLTNDSSENSVASDCKKARIKGNTPPRARTRTEMRDELEDSPYRPKHPRHPSATSLQEPEVASSYQPTNSPWVYDAQSPSPSGSSHDSQKIGSLLAADWEMTHRGGHGTVQDSSGSHRLDLSSRFTSTSSESPSVVSIALLNDPLIDGKQAENTRRDRPKKLWISWLFSRNFGSALPKNRRYYYQTSDEGDETDVSDDDKSDCSSTSSEGLLSVAANALYATWRYNGRSIMFVFSFCLMTLCIIPLLIKVYWIDYDQEVNATTDFARCLVTASMSCGEQTQVGVNNCALVSCGSHPSKRSWMPLITVILLFIFGFGIIPSIIFGITGDLKPNAEQEHYKDRLYSNVSMSSLHVPLHPQSSNGRRHTTA